MSADLITIGHDVLDKSFTFESDTGEKYHNLWYRTFDLFKLTLYFITEKRLYTEFASIRNNDRELTEIPIVYKYECFLSYIFHTVQLYFNLLNGSHFIVNENIYDKRE